MDFGSSVDGHVEDLEGAGDYETDKREHAENAGGLG